MIGFGLKLDFVLFFVSVFRFIRFFFGRGGVEVRVFYIICVRIFF